MLRSQSSIERVPVYSSMDAARRARLRVPNPWLGWAVCGHAFDLDKALHKAQQDSCPKALSIL
eukprot:4547517-Prymnesium_polylepis.1